MLPHAVVGAALGSRVKSPYVAFALGVASHFLLDAVPHADYPLEGTAGKARLLVDAGLACGAVYLVARSSNPKGSLSGALGGIAPDLVSFAQRLSLGGSTAWHDWAHTTPAPLASSMALQLALSGTALALAVRRPRASLA